MSRSYKKPIYKDGGHQRKKLASRAYRRVCKQRISVYRKEEQYFLWQEDMDQYLMDQLFLPHPYEVTDPWDICDWRCVVRKVTLYGPMGAGQISDNTERYLQECRK